LAWYLANDDPQHLPFDARTVLIVDEASTISDRDLDHLFQLAEAAGPTIRLIGDPAQHGAIAAGGMIRVLCEQHPGLTPELTTTRRLLHRDDIRAVEALRVGDVENALDALHDAGHLHLAADDVQLYGRLLTRWWTARQAGQPHPLVERSNHRRRQLNRLAHCLLQIHGEIGTEELRASGGRCFSVGDEVIARLSSRDLHPPGIGRAYVRNGARGVIVAIERGADAKDDLMTVQFEGGAVRIPRSFFDAHRGRRRRLEVGIDHAYAVTSYAVQGATFQVSTSRIDERSSRSETYVDITRGRHENHLYATRAADPLDGERLPRAPEPPLEVTVAIRLKASAGEVTAWELDPHALDRLNRLTTTPTIT
jgi:ATP-dependent exoDNAse (exonuclease V) alpha subunit